MSTGAPAPEVERDRDLLTIPEAVADPRLFDGRVHAETLRRQARAGLLPYALQIGSRWFISVPKARRFLHGETS